MECRNSRSATAALELLFKNSLIVTFSKLLFRLVPATTFVTGDNEVERDQRNP